MRTTLSVIVAVACLFLLPGCKEKKSATSSADSSDTSSGNPLTAPADYLGAISKAQKQAQKTLSTVGLDQAIKTFYNEEGRLPKDLNELVAKGTIGQVPPPPRGMKYDYDSKTGIIKVVPE